MKKIGFLMLLGLATSTCVHSFFQDQDSEWQFCNDSCLTCESNASQCLSCDPLGTTPFKHNTSCLATCPQQYFPLNNECTQCHSSCSQCSNSSSSGCTACPGNAVLNNGSCQACPSNQYNQNGTCQNCPNSCSTCTSATTCTSCAASHPYFEAVTGVCHSVCPSGYYASGSQCLACDPNCMTCSGSSSHCLTCELGMELSSSNTCILPSCSDGQYRSGGSQCQSCNSNCLLCVNSASSCYFCNEQSSFPLLHSQTCVPTCPDGTYSDEQNCLACDSSCATCTAAEPQDCLTCSGTLKPPLNFSGNITCALSSCPDGFYNSTNICTACHSSCATCSSPNQCLTCPGNAIRLQSGLCSPCPAGSYASQNVCTPCQSPCLNCNSQQNCTSCVTNTFLNSLNSQCVQTCPSGYYPDNGNCVKCASPCSTCSAAGVCTGCSSPLPKFTPALNTCTKTCNSGYYDSNHVCLPCDSSCLTCSTSATHCTSCNQQTNLILLNKVSNSCVAQCPSGSFNYTDACYSCCTDSCLQCSNGPTNCTACPTPSPLLFTNACYSTCPAGSYQSSSSSCTACPTGCSQCQSGSICTACSDGFYRSGNNCLACEAPCSTCSTGPTDCLNCPAGSYRSGSTCLPCQSPCANCTSAINCESCVANFILSSTTCSACPSGTYSSDSTSCITCDPGCSECSSQQVCTTCAPGFYLSNSRCQPCDQQCATCSTSGSSCASCSAGYYLSGTSCVPCDSPCLTCDGSATSCSSCVAGFYPSASNSCVPCSSSCSKCSSQSVCSACAAQFYLSGNTCLGRLPLLSLLACNSACNGCTGPGSSACKSCASKFYNSTSVCLACDNSCAQCNGPLSTQCTACMGSSFTNPDGSCSSCSIPSCSECESATACQECDSGFFLGPDSTSCSTCDANCKNCYATGSQACSECNSPLALYQSQCIASCPYGLLNINNECRTCNNGFYIFQGACLQCPTSSSSVLATNQLLAALVRCTFSSLTSSEITRIVQQLNGASPTSSTGITQLIAQTTNLQRSISQTITSSKFSLQQTQGNLSGVNIFQSQDYSIQASFSAGSATSIFTTIFLQPGDFAASGITPLTSVVDISLNPFASIPGRLEFNFKQNAPQKRFLCSFWNNSTHSWSQTGVTTSLSGSKVICETTHTTAFTLIPHADGVSFSDSANFILPISILILLALIIIISLLLDCLVVRKQRRPYKQCWPHLKTKKPHLLLYTILYNLPLINIFAFGTDIIRQFCKALLFSAQFMLIFTLQTLFFNAQIYSSADSSSLFIIFLLCFIFLPHSLLPCCLIKYPAKEPIAQNAYRPSTMRTENAFESTEQMTQKMPPPVLSLVGLFLLFITSILIIIVGLAVGFSLQDKIYSLGLQDSYNLSIALIYPFALILSFIKIYLSYCCRKRKDSCCYKIMVDYYLIKIEQDYAENKEIILEETTKKRERPATSSGGEGAFSRPEEGEIFVDVTSPKH